MSGLPTVQVLLDDGTGTYPSDVTAYVRLVDGVSVSSYARTDEFASAGGASLSLVLDNSDGFLTTGSGFGVLPFGSGPFGGGVQVYPGQGIRLKLTKGATTRTRFTGRVVSCPVSWPGGGQSFSVVTVTAADRFADMARRPLRSMLEEEILLDSPTAYYTLAEPTGSVSAGDTSGRGAPALTIAGTGAAPTFGTGTGPGVDGLTAPQFFGGQRLQASASSWFSLATGFTVECFMSSTAIVPAITETYLLNLDDLSGAGYPTAVLRMATGGFPALGANSFEVVGGTPINDGRVHHLAVTVTAGGTATAYVDGVSIGTTATGTPAPRPAISLALGAYAYDGSSPYTGTISHAAIYSTTLSAARIAAHAAVGSGAVSENTAVRVARLASYGGYTSATTAGMSGQLVAAQATTGQSLLDAVQAVAAAEGAPVYADGSGVITLQGRNYRAQKLTTDLTLTNDALNPDTAITWDNQQIVNHATATRTGGATQDYLNTASKTTYGEYPQSLDLPVDTDANALLAAQWLVNTHKTPVQRLAAATFDLLTTSTAETVLQREVGDRITLTPLPSQAWAATVDATLEGWTETVTDQAWDLTANLLPWSLFTAFTLDNATYGVLDSTTPIGY